MKPTASTPLRILLLEDIGTLGRDKDRLVDVLAATSSGIGRSAQITWSRNAYWAIGPNCPWNDFDLVVADAMMPPFLPKLKPGAPPTRDAKLGKFGKSQHASLREAVVPPNLKELKPETKHGGMMVAKWLAGAGSAWRGNKLKFILTTAVGAGEELARDAANFERDHPWFVMVPKPEGLKVEHADVATIEDGFFEQVVGSLIREHDRQDWGLKLFHDERIVFRDPKTKHEVFKLWRHVQLCRDDGRLAALAILGDEGAGRTTLALAAIKRFMGASESTPRRLVAATHISVQQIDDRLANEDDVLWLAEPQRLPRPVLEHLSSIASAPAGPARMIVVEADPTSLPDQLNSCLAHAKFQLPTFAIRRLDYPGIFAAHLHLGRHRCVSSDDLERLILRNAWTSENQLMGFANWCGSKFSATAPIPASALAQWKSEAGASAADLMTLTVLPKTGPVTFVFDHRKGAVTLSADGASTVLKLRAYCWAYSALWHWITRQKAGKRPAKWQDLLAEYSAITKNTDNFPKDRSAQSTNVSGGAGKYSPSAYQTGMSDLLVRLAKRPDAWKQLGKASGVTQHGQQGNFAALVGREIIIAS